MSEEELKLIDGFFNKGWCCNLDEVYNAVMKLQQENQQLKDNKNFCEMINDKEWVDYKFEYENNQRVMKDLYKQLDLYKSVIDELNEELSMIDNDIMAVCENYDVNGIELKKILDKAKGSDK